MDSRRAGGISGRRSSTPPGFYYLTNAPMSRFPVFGGAAADRWSLANKVEWSRMMSQIKLRPLGDQILNTLDLNQNKREMA